MIKEYRKKPVVIEALEFKSGMTIDKICSFVTCDASFSGAGETVDSFEIETLEGEMEVSDGDFVIKGVKGEFYPCKSDIFEMTYEKV